MIMYALVLTRLGTHRILHKRVRITFCMTQYARINACYNTVCFVAYIVQASS